MNENIIILSILILHLLVFLTLLRMLKMKVKAIKSKQIKTKDFILTKDSVMSDEVLNVSNHLRNLFQIPILFQILAVICIVTNNTSLSVVILCVFFSLSRVVHSYIHLFSSNVKMRFRSYLLGLIILLILWISTISDLFFA